MVIHSLNFCFNLERTIIQPYVGRTWKSSVILFFMAYAFPNLTSHLLLTNCMKYITWEGNVSNLYSRWTLRSKIICFISGYDNADKQDHFEKRISAIPRIIDFIFYTLHMKTHRALYINYCVNLDGIIFPQCENISRFNLQILISLPKENN